MNIQNLDTGFAMGRRAKLSTFSRFALLFFVTSGFSTLANSAECPLGHHNVEMDNACRTITPDSEICSYAAHVGTPIVGSDTFIQAQHTPASGPPATINPTITGGWRVTPATPPPSPPFPAQTVTCPSGAGTGLFTCIGIDFDVPTATSSANNRVQFSGTPASTGVTYMDIQAVDSSTCVQKYEFHVTTNGGGWGDPHITTVDGVHYDFQGAGEYVALRGKDMEIQTRQTAVSKKHKSRANGYTKLPSCVSIYTAVAAKIAGHRVTIQPSLDGAPSPEGLQLRIDGHIHELTAEGINLDGCECGEGGECECSAANTAGGNRIIQTADKKGYQIEYANGTKLVVTPAWWAGQKKWYLNVNVYDTDASEGIMGAIAQDSWLPKLSDGSKVGSMPVDTDLAKRYDDLYRKFGNSWRVKKRHGDDDDDEEEERSSHRGRSVSLFDYAPNTSTDDYTIMAWPFEEGDSCELEGEPLAEPPPGIMAVAIEACKDVRDENSREDCIFDISETGNTDFANTYVSSEAVVPGGTITKLSADSSVSKRGTNVTFTAQISAIDTQANAADVNKGSVVFFVDGALTNKALALDNNGEAVWNSADLATGKHEIVAQYVPSGFVGKFRSSKSAKLSHIITPPFDLAYSFHAGPSVPSGNFSNAYGQGLAWQLDAEYKLAPRYSLVAMYGYNQFKGDAMGVDDTHISNVSLDFKYYLKTGTQTFWAMAGFGKYKPENVGWRSGSNFGVGYQFYRSPHVRGEVGVNNHTVYSDDGDVHFYTGLVGVIYNF